MIRTLSSESLQWIELHQRYCSWLKNFFNLETCVFYVSFFISSLTNTIESVSLDGEGIIFCSFIHTSLVFVDMLKINDGILKLNFLVFVKLWKLNQAKYVVYSKGTFLWMWILNSLTIQPSKCHLCLPIIWHHWNSLIGRISRRERWIGVDDSSNKIAGLEKVYCQI